MSQNRHPLRRNPRMALGLLLSVLVLAAGATALATFDLNDHRQRVQVLLSEALGRRVTLGAARFSLRHGPSLRFNRIDIPPTAASGWDLRAEEAFLRLEWAPLLRGRIGFSEIVLEKPILQLRIEPGLPPSPHPEPKRWELPGIRSISIRQGILAIDDRRDPDQPRRWRLERLDARLLGPASGRQQWISLSGELLQEGESARFEMAGDLVPAADIRQARLNLGIRLQRFRPGPVLEAFLPAASATGSLTLNLTANGSAATGLRFSTDLTGEGLTIHAPGQHHSIPVEKAGFAGLWTWRPEGSRLDGLELRLDEITCRGSLEWRPRDHDIYLAADLATPPVPLLSLLRLLPETWAAPWSARVGGGEVEAVSLRYAGLLNEMTALSPNLPLQARLAVRDLTLIGPNGRQLSQVAFRAAVSADLLQVEDGTALWVRSPVRFAGTVESPFEPRRELTAEIEGDLPAADLAGGLPGGWGKAVTVAGSLPVSIWVSGTADRLLMDARADLSPISLAAREFRKGAGEEGTLLLAGELLPDRVELSHARLHLPPVELRARGQLTRDGSESFSLVLDAAGFDLEAARSSIPLLTRLQARGRADLHLELAGERGKLQTRQGTLRLHGVGVHLSEALADLRQAEGSLRLEGDRLLIESLSARLGDSPLRATGVVENFADPQVRLQVHSRAMRADALIFSSPTAVLRDLEGELRLSRSGIVFDPVRVRLDGGTRAVVEGEVRLQPQAVVELDIAAEYGNIDEVIALWSAPGEERQATPPESRSEPLVRIQAAAAEGEIGGMRFRQAQGLITWEQGLLSIHPLQFRIGEGSGQGVVLVDSRLSPSLLQVSGHLEEVDAAAVHQQLLKRRGLLEGKLSGDFHLEGRLGETFLQTSRGGANLQVREGVLRRYTVLARVFSLLNISQIFTLRLPDMAREGMPFDQLTTNFSLADGVLATEDLLVDSNAMNLSLVGEADLASGRIDFIMGVKPLRTVDKIVTHIPVAGWLLAGEEKALVTAHFQVRGSADDPEVVPVPITSVSEKVLGIFRRVFNLPAKMVTDLGGVVAPANQ